MGMCASNGSRHIAVLRFKTMSEFLLTLVQEKNNFCFNLLPSIDSSRDCEIGDVDYRIFPIRLL